MTQDPLQSLVVDVHEVDRERLAQLLHGWVRVDPSQGVVRFLPGVRDSATIAQLILITLFGRTALHLLDKKHADGMTPAELTRATGVKGSSLRPQLKRLTDGGIVMRREDGCYTVPVHSFDLAAEELRGTDA